MFKSSARTARKSAQRPLTGFERLESREVLSANLVPSANFDLAIRGTDVEFSPLNLPAALQGDVHLAANGRAGHAAIGRYQETLTPIFMDINGDSLPDFVGTQGVATFTFFIGAPQHAFGSITTTETSYIQGVTAEGQLVVGSQGTIIGTSGGLLNLSGGFVSQSTVGLYPTFEMQTNLHFTVNRSISPVFTVLAVAADVYGASAAENTPPADDPSSTDETPDNNSDHGKHEEHDKDVRLDKAERHELKLAIKAVKHEAHDSIFAHDVDWLLGKAKKELSV